MRIRAPKYLPLFFSLLAISGNLLSVQAQIGGGGGGGGGIPLGGGSKSQDDNAEKPDKKTLNERPVTGIVTDAEGNPLKGAVVQLKDMKTLKIRSVITHEKGDYTFTGLSKDIDYQVTALLNEHSSDVHKLSSFDSRPRPVVNLQIK